MLLLRPTTHTEGAVKGMIGSGAGTGARRTGMAAAMVAAAVAAAVWLVALMGMPGEADARPRFKIVTRTFHNFSAITINDSTGQVSPYPSALAAGGFKRGKILDANVTLRGFSHTFPDDVDVLLVHGARNATIMSDVGGTTPASNVTLRLDDEAGAFLPENSQLVSGSFRPTNVNPGGTVDTFPGAPAPSGLVALSTFDRANPNGLWSLFVEDDLDRFDGGQFAAGWSLQIKAKVPVKKRR